MAKLRTQIKYHEPEEKFHVSKTEAAKILHLAKVTVNELIEQGLLHTFTTPGKGKKPRIRIFRSSLNLLIGKRGEQ